MAKKKSVWRDTVLNSVRYILGTMGGVGITLVSLHYKKPSSQEIEASLKTTTMTATAYSAERFNKKTALGHTVKPGVQIAVSRDRKDLLGKRVLIDGYGVKEVLDVMGEGKTNSIDILVPTEKDAKAFGVKKVEVNVIGN